MGDFNKSEYDKLYNKNNRTMIRVNVSNEEKANFDAHCTRLNIKCSAYLKKLVNDDAIKRGMPLVFQGRISEK